MGLIALRQLNQAELALFIQQTSSGSAFSGNFVAYVAASGWLGPLAVTTTGDQFITGRKTFALGPLVPYSGGSGAAPSALYVQDQDRALSGVLTGQIGALSGFILTMSGMITGMGGGGISPSFSGYVENTFVHRTAINELISGNKTFIGSTIFNLPTRVANPVATGDAVNLGYINLLSGVLASGGGSSVRVSGSSPISSPNFTGAGSAFVSYDGTYITISGSGAGGGGTTNYFITGTGVVAAYSSGIVTNTFNITSGNAIVNSSGIVSNTFNGTTNINIGALTGNFVNISFWLDEYTLSTGLNVFEAFVARDFTFTGYAIGVINSGTQGSFSGSFYQRTSSNTKVSFVNFGMPPGQFFSGRGGLIQTISGMNRVGVDIYSVGTGITGLSLGLFGVGY